MNKTPVELFGVECGKGWHSIIEPLLAYCKKHNIKIFQIKEKFGGLRFYAEPDEYNGKLEKMIEEAEAKAWKTCEECGEPGMLREGGWLRTLCDLHAQGREPYDRTKYGL